MGLDITVYEHVRLVEEVHAREDSDGNYCEDALGHARVYGDDFPDQLGSLVNGKCYTTEGERMGFRAGSYGGYGHWRAALCRAALAVDPQEVWDSPEEYADRPFFELIWFSDCEGTIGPEASAELARDFQEQPDSVRANLEQFDDWYAEQYDVWQAAFELAADDGMVVFH